jgi:RHS repeat-associated protein
MLTDKLFTGQREMTDLGIYHYNARFYSPYINRFLSADTIVPGYANPQNLNRYSYVLNNPLRYNDPTGHKACGGPNKPCLGKSTQKNGNDSGNSTIITSTNPSIGEPQNLGEYLSGVWMGGGGPNSYYVGGVTPESEGDRVYLTGSSAGLQYGAIYSIEFYEHGAYVHITEYYQIREGTLYTDVASAGSILNIKTSDGVAHTVPLGEFEIGRKHERNTTVTVYGPYPATMNITIIISLSQTLVMSAPLPVFEFNSNPAEVFP